MEKSLRELLLKDLCARLPYGLLVKTPDHYSPQVVNSISDNLEVIVQKNLGYSLLYEAKPYLRPMESITEEEKKEYHSILDFREKEYGNEVEYFCMETDIHDCFDFLNSHHLDYRGLIPKGLALEAKEGMYIIK